MIYDPGLAPLRRQRTRARADAPAVEPRVVRVAPDVMARLDELSRALVAVRDELIARVSLIEDRLSPTEDRLSLIEDRMAQPTHPDQSDDLPAFLREKRQQPPPMPASAVKQIIADDVHARLDALERDIAAAISAAPAVPAPSPGPPLRVVEAAHLARSGQEAPIALMERVAKARGCSWEEAAIAIIKEHDAAVAAAVDKYIGTST